MIEILESLPKIVSAKAVKDIVWPRLNNYINKLLDENVDKALEFITNMLNKMGHDTYNNPLYLLRAKLQGKRLSIIRRYKQHS